ncbi:hypothetical protein SRHO_G00194830 [Serrasalmus rhombeus]
MELEDNRRDECMTERENKADWRRRKRMTVLSFALSFSRPCSLFVMLGCVCAVSQSFISFLPAPFVWTEGGEIKEEVRQRFVPPLVSSSFPTLRRDVGVYMLA